LVFFRVPSAKPATRTDFLTDPKRVPFRLVFDEEKPLTEWVKAEVVRRFAHTCCDDIQSLNQVDWRFICCGAAWPSVPLGRCWDIVILRAHAFICVWRLKI
jgi:uncharacterized protein YPO0396